MAFILAKHYKRDGDKMSVAEAITVPRVAISSERLAHIRSRLRQKMREFWDSPEGQMLALALSETAIKSGWRKVMKDFWDKSKRDYLSAKAEEIGLGAKYKVVWGKPLELEEYTEYYK